MVKSHHARRRTAIVLLLAFVGMCGGCVERRYTVRTEPPGARSSSMANPSALRRPPITSTITAIARSRWSWTAIETKTIIQPINAPWWDNYLTEFFSENLVPYVIRDEREFTYKMEPYRAPTEEEIQGRAEALRSEAKVLPPPRRGGILGWLGF